MLTHQAQGHRGSTNRRWWRASHTQLATSDPTKGGVHRAQGRTGDWEFTNAMIFFFAVVAAGKASISL
ncbi:Homogentisate 1,2-dioxygenase [Fusarium oxysporum f. sp. albedinis]|nr:Homogentisate 1,2-dioxygenase [Fusarium oxysporum f. sp. albedinis]